MSQQADNNPISLAVLLPPDWPFQSFRPCTAPFLLILSFHWYYSSFWPAVPASSAPHTAPAKGKQLCPLSLESLSTLLPCSPL